ncbi:MAG: MBL fold metallo-hydrolase [bacterium]|nr:MBL fold metallo-hydrolase [bacterium]
MKNCLKLLVLLITILPVTVFSQENDYTSVRFEKISDRLYVIFGGGLGANAGLYIGDNGLLIVDPKMNKRASDEVFEKIRELTGKSIIYVVNTHSDPDHILGNRYFPETVTFIAHENCRREFTEPNWNGSPSEWTAPEYAPYFPSITFRDQMDIYLGSKKIELWYFGRGHTSGDAVVYFPEEKTAFIGDQLMMGHRPGAHPYKGGNTFENVRTLSKMLTTLDADKFVNGHLDRIADRETVRDYIRDVRIMQDNIRARMILEDTLEDIKKDYSDRLQMFVEHIYKEIIRKKY